ncbi:putative thymidylate synthase [Bacillus phage BSP21]|uniref:thymidylate synthase n=1 Tax=Bacillus phage SPG24 TaxID=1497851 RepID=UPI000EB65610|nr:thymidylate synthase [Bacillus phage SPG24]ATN94516.1 putative thymidylate synthase [Bacillus phage BSP9]AYJ75500.1 putative thymidylate synthase [Bacillus phage BSP21]
MYHVDTEYFNLVKKIMDEGTFKDDRTGTGTLSLFGPQMEFDLSKGFPMLTTKKLPFRIIAEELFWFINGDTDLKTLLDKNINIWTDDAYRFYLDNGGSLTKSGFIQRTKNAGFDLGPIYGKQWRSWGGVVTVDDSMRYQMKHDQLFRVIKDISTNPDSRRHIVSAWNVGDLEYMALPPCHVLFQFYVVNGTLSCKLYMRSNDIFLGAPFNIASYALLTHIIAKMTGLKVGKLIYSVGDAHIYVNHLDLLKSQMEREPKEMPQLEVKAVHENIEDYTLEDIVLTGYDAHPTIKGKLSTGLKEGDQQ